LPTSRRDQFAVDQHRSGNSGLYFLLVSFMKYPG
jgi:hypothetical protein